MKKGCVSIIVPVYNQEHCIKDCLNSILCQSYDNLQVIVVDDGSTDRTGDIIDSISKRDHRIEVYHVENQGVSNARNYGLFRVKGEYVQFVDADDRIKSHMTETMVETLEKSHTDMVVCNYIKRFDDRLSVRNEAMEHVGRYCTREYLLGALKDPGHHYYGVVWNKLYRTELLEKYDIKFESEMTLGEDFIFNIYYWTHSQRVSVISKYLYIYNKENGTTLSNVRNKKLVDCINELENRRRIFEVYKNALKEYVPEEQIEERLYRYWIVFYIRQKYDLKYEYVQNWSDRDKKKWCNMLQADENIRKGFSIVSDRWMKQYQLKYKIDYWIKKAIKNVLRIG